MSIFDFFRKKNKDSILIAKEQIERNSAVLQSLEDYDAGKKEISTAHLERDLPNISVTP